MKTALIAINSKYVHSSLAVWYLYAAAKERGYECEVVEGSINEDEDALLSGILSTDADVLGFSTYIWNADRVLSLSQRIKAQRDDIKIILGGPEVSYRAEDVLLRYPYVDIVISGEGEVPFALLLSALSSGSSVRDIKGVSFREGENIFISDPYTMKEDPPSPYCDKYFESLRGRIAYIETSRGCPYSCAYCLSSVQRMRHFDIEKAKRDILLLSASGSKTVKFVDRTFNASRKRASELVEFIINNRIEGNIPEGVTFHFEIAGDLVDETLLALLKKAPAGLFQLEIGVQSFNPDTLSSIGRSADTKHLSDVIRELSSYGNVHIHTDLIAGLPHEDLGSFKNSYNTLYSLGSHKLQLGFLKLLYGSAMKEQPELYPCEYEAHAPYTVKSTPWLSEDDLRELELVERANDGIFFSSRFKRTTEYMLSATGYDPYTLALRLGAALYRGKTPALDSLTDMLFEECKKMNGVDAAVLRDMMLYDRISHNNSCVIPQSLRVTDKDLGRAVRALSKKFPQSEGVRRCVGILYHSNRVIFADYKDKHPVSELYRVYEIPLDELLCKEGEE